MAEELEHNCIVISNKNCAIKEPECIGPFRDFSGVVRFFNDHNLWAKELGTCKFITKDQWEGVITIPEDWVHPKERG